MNELARIVTHYLEAITRKAKLSGFDEMRVELEGAAESDAEYVAVLEARIDALAARICTLERFSEQAR